MNSVEKALAKRDGWIKDKPSKQSALKLGAKHAARVSVTRTMKSMLGNGLLGDIGALLARNVINKGVK